MEANFAKAEREATKGSYVDDVPEELQGLVCPCDWGAPCPEHDEPCDCGLQGPQGGFVTHEQGAPGCELERCCAKAEALPDDLWLECGCPEEICGGCYDSKPHDARHCHHNGCRCADHVDPCEWCRNNPEDDEGLETGCGRRTPSQVGCADSACGRPSGDTAHAARSRDSRSFNDQKEVAVSTGLLADEFQANRDRIARTEALLEVMQEEVARREAGGFGADDPRARLFAFSAREDAAARRPTPVHDHDRPIFGERVYAVGFRGRVIQFLGYSDDPATSSKVLALGDHWQIRRESEVQDSVSDEWWGRAVSEPGSVERDAAEREAWDDYEFAKTHREEVAAERFEYRGRDSRGGFSDADAKSRRQRADQQLQLELERGAEVLGDERHRQALTERKRFRAWVEAFGQDPDAPEIVAWRESKTYAACNAQLRAKALRDGVLLPAVA